MEGTGGKAFELPSGDAAIGLRVLDSVADQVAQNGTEMQRVALDRGAGRGSANADPLPLGRNCILASSLLQQGPDPHRPVSFAPVLAELQGGN